jgi:hypothetical protein
MSENEAKSQDSEQDDDEDASSGGEDAVRASGPRWLAFQG